MRAQVERVVGSRIFETSEVHRRLLQYLAEKTLAGEGDRLKEFTVGLEAFGKPPTYDPKHDSIVRLQVGRLRQKLLAYYQSEGAGDPLVVTVPKGGFKLSIEEPPARNGDAAHASAWVSRHATVILGAALAAALLWAGVATTLLVPARRAAGVVARRWNPELESLWAPNVSTPCAGPSPPAKSWPGTRSPGRAKPVPLSWWPNCWPRASRISC